MKKLLIFRFSAMGDVALLLPVVLNIIKQNPNLKITIVTRDKFQIFFEGYPNINIISVDFDKKHKGFLGLIELFSELNLISPDYVFDLHQNIRTQVLKFFFFFTKVKVFGFDKGRSEKRKLTQKTDFKPLAHVTERYLDVFKKSGLIPIEASIEKLPSFFHTEIDVENKTKTWLAHLDYQKLVGIAPFAQHKGKIWPIEKYRELIILIAAKYPESVFLIFGGGDKEKNIIKEVLGELPNVENLVGRFTIGEELALIQKLDIMICGDSSNMHFAAISNVPVVSIWGSTHSFAGFGVIFQPENLKVEIDKTILTCRPCSIYGNKPCYRKDYACLEWITPQMVMDKVDFIF